MTEGPGLGGYPELAKPQQRVTQAYRSLWTALRVDGPKKSLRAMQAVHATQALIRKRRR